jgi:hypothetical protein
MTAFMNDSEKTELTPANDNPWYLLATLYGEQASLLIDKTLAEKNRIAWNRWVAAALSDQERVTLINEGFSEAELTPFSDIEKKEHYVAVLIRSGRESITLPEPWDSIDFHAIRFDHSCNFGGYLFARIVSFESTRFSMPANFQSTTFNDYANFHSVIFGAFADFRSAKFNAFASFDSATFNATAHFEWAKYNFNADFVNSKFLSATEFSHVTFRSAVPRFFGATLHEGTTWHGVVWPSPSLSRDADTNKALAQQQVYAYERLKQEMEKLKKHEDEQFFFRKELRARRELHPMISTHRLLNFLYELLSNYGYGVLRPVGWFGGLFFVGFVLFAIDPLEFSGKKLTTLDAAFTSFANMFGSLPLKTLANYTTDKTFAYSAEIFAIFQTIAGAVLLFLFFLALRNRFRLR